MRLVLHPRVYSDIDKIMGGNWLDFFERSFGPEKAERPAQDVSAKRAASKGV